MASPADITILNLEGEFIMDKTLSDQTDPLLALQGISWTLRTILAYANITLQIHEYPDSEDKKVLHIDIDQIVTGGIKGTSEKRQTDWVEREHSDHIFGTVKGQTRLIRGSKGEDGKVLPNLDISTKLDDPKVKKFLRGEILADGSDSEGFIVDNEGEAYGEGEGVWLQSYVVNQDEGYGWTAEQVWGFENVDGKRYYTRRIVVVKDGSYKLARLVYSFVPKQDE